MDDIQKIIDQTKVDTDRERVKEERLIQEAADTQTDEDGNPDKAAQDEASAAIKDIEYDRRNSTS